MSKTAVKKEGEKPSVIRKITSSPVFGPYMSLVIVIIISAIADSKFLTPSNISNIMTRAVTVGVVSVGMTIVMLVGAIDLSVSYIMGASACLLAHMLQGKEGGIGIGPVILCLLLGCLIGLVNGVITVTRNLESFIVTLGVGEVVHGITMIYTKGTPCRVTVPFWGKFGSGSIAGIPYLLILYIVVLAIFMVLMHKTVFGRHIYAIGSNAEAARLTGIKVRINKIMAFVICGFTAAVAGVMLVAKVTTGAPNGGSGYDMDSIAAVVIGGTAMSGGKGTLAGTIAGVFLMAIMTNILNLVHADANLQGVIKGLIILVAVIIQRQDK